MCVMEALEIPCNMIVPADEPDIAVFRFTLGIPGFDDADIPRILGWAAIALLTLNHVLDDSPSDASQVRNLPHSEAIS